MYASFQLLDAGHPKLFLEVAPDPLDGKYIQVRRYSMSENGLDILRPLSTPGNGVRSVVIRTACGVEAIAN